MRRRRISFSADPRRTALKRAGLAVAAALALLLGVLWFGDSDQPSPPPLPAPVADAILPPQPEASATEMPAPEVGTPAPEVGTLVPMPGASMVSEPAETPAPAAEENAPAQGSAPVPEASATAQQPATPQEPQKPAEPPPKQVSLSDGYFVQLGVFNSTDNAVKLFDNVSSTGMTAHIQSRVVVGPFRNKREAEAARRRLKDIAEGTVLPPQKTAAKTGKSKAKSRRRAR
ncbi:MAG: SPOR domain-containing protein [Azoarcus sp.]|jgi:cell division septation protein DedD|nr:SPOR domain-containing protein [Azoarcus sp.]